MNKKEFINFASKENNITKIEANNIVNSFCSSIMYTLSSEKEAYLTDVLENSK